MRRHHPLKTILIRVSRQQRSFKHADCAVNLAAVNHLKTSPSQFTQLLISTTHKEMLSSSQVPRATRAIRPPVTPHPSPIPRQPITLFTYTSDQCSDPDEPVQTNIRQRMMLAFMDRGYRGLGMELYRQAEEKGNANLKPASWRNITNDRTEGHFTVYIQLLSPAGIHCAFANPKHHHIRSRALSED